MERDYVWIGVQYGKDMETLGGPTEGPFIVPHRSTGEFFIERGDVVERVNSSRVTDSPTPTKGRSRENFETTPEDLRAKKTTGSDCLVRKILKHCTHCVVT